MIYYLINFKIGNFKDLFKSSIFIDNDDYIN